MYSEIRVSGRAGVAEIDIEGVIGVPEKMQFDKPGDRVTTYSKFTESLRQISAIDAQEVVVNIRSTGGDVNDALLIYDALIGLEAKVTTRCYGYVASAATIIAQAAAPGAREISESTLYLIHCSESAAEGNSSALSRTVELLDKTDVRIADIYAARSGREAAGFVALMKENEGRGKWLSAVEAVDAGLADKLIDRREAAGEANEKVLNDVAVAVAAMLGLTELPGTESVAKGDYSRMLRVVRSFFARMMRPIGRKETGKSEVRFVAAASNSNAGGCGRLPQDKTVVFQLRDAQKKAIPTKTSSREDPSVGEPRRSANEQAYYDDVLNLKI